jgi:alanine racemase
MVRPGAALYGIDPGNLKECGVELEPVLSWHTQVVFLKGVEEGTPIGYNRNFIAPRKMRIATLCVGYNDGFHFIFSNRGEVLIRGKRCKVVGNVTMDYIMVDVTDVPDVSVGDTVTLLGRNGGDELTCRDLAQVLSAPPYVITTSLGKRVKRVYRDACRMPEIEPYRERAISDKKRQVAS